MLKYFLYGDEKLKYKGMQIIQELNQLASSILKKAIYSQYHCNGKLVRVSSSCTAATLAVLCLEQKNQRRNFD